MLGFLLRHEIIPPQSQDSERERAVHYALRKHDVPLLKLLHDHGCPINQYDHFDYLKEAMNVHSPEDFEGMLDILLSYGVDINTKGYSGKSCLWNAIRRREAFRLEILLQKGANPLFHTSRNKETLLMFVALANFAEGVKLLLEAIVSRVSPQELGCHVYAALRIARFQGSGKVTRVLERVYYCELPGKV